MFTESEEEATLAIVKLDISYGTLYIFTNMKIILLTKSLPPKSMSAETANQPHPGEVAKAEANCIFLAFSHQ